MTQLMQDKIALVTGTSAGIGAGIAEVFAREGADVVVNYRSSLDGAEATAKTIRDHGRRALVVQADVSSSEQVERLVQEAAQHFGRIDVLVNNAGLTARSGFMEADEAFYDKMMDTDLKGIYLCSRRAVPVMKKSGGGRIINISSVHATRTSHDFSIYAAAKGGGGHADPRHGAGIVRRWNHGQRNRPGLGARAQRGPLSETSLRFPGCAFPNKSSWDDTGSGGVGGFSCL